MERNLIELGKLIVDDSLKHLDESERKQREIELYFERKRKRLVLFAWILAITFIVSSIALAVWIFVD